MEFRNKSMLEYSKEVLTKLSFDASLFKNEVKKSLKWLNKNEQEELNKWLIREYAYLKSE